MSSGQLKSTGSDSLKDLAISRFDHAFVPDWVEEDLMPRSTMPDGDIDIFTIVDGKLTTRAFGEDMVFEKQ